MSHGATTPAAFAELVLVAFAALLAGGVAGVLAVWQIFKWGMKTNPGARDALRRVLNYYDGYPFVRCPHCAAVFSTAPELDDDDDEDEESEA